MDCGLTHLGGSYALYDTQGHQRPTQGYKIIIPEDAITVESGLQLELPEVTAGPGNVGLGQEAVCNPPEQISSPESSSSVCAREGFGIQQGLH